MKKSLFKFTAPALAVGLALSAHGGVSAADHKAEKAEAKENKAQVSQSFKKGSDVSHRLVPVEKKVFSANDNLVELETELVGKESLTAEELVYFQGQVDSVVGKLGAATNQLAAVTKKFDENSTEVIKVEVAIGSSIDAAQLTQQYLNSLEIVEEVPELEEPEVPTEPEPTEPDEPVIP
ncbi:hypothetical protein [Planomicrobium sp. Y74]|uniref:hypothetical protein n=1 Tax=Planomicrobium sp. Y74 TaxID=2478977 RepID=UPI000EF4F66D|nr:hypothetical protein [Planomicrobium sp. Y74]RLQ84898.1 hypothetical protein D9754_16655 [Planomicrobium sp. Y74]